LQTTTTVNATAPPPPKSAACTVGVASSARSVLTLWAHACAHCAEHSHAAWSFCTMHALATCARLFSSLSTRPPPPFCRDLMMHPEVEMQRRRDVRAQDWASVHVAPPRKGLCRTRSRTFCGHPGARATAQAHAPSSASAVRQNMLVPNNVEGRCCAPSPMLPCHAVCYDALSWW